MSDLPRLYLDGVALSAYTTQQIMDWGRLCQKEVGDELAAEQQKRAADAAQYQADEIEWNEQLAAAQATIEQMREALESKVSISEVLMEAHEDSCRIHDDAMFCTCGAYDAIRINKAIAIPTNLDALHEAMALECERLRDFARKRRFDGYGDLDEFDLTEEAAAHRARKGSGNERLSNQY